MLVRRWIPVLALALAGAAACERSATGPAQLQNGTPPAVCATYADIPVATRPHLLVDAEWLKANLDRPNVVVLHFGVGDGAYKTGHIPGARLIMLSQIQGGTPTMPKSLAELKDVLEQAGVSTSDRVIVTGDSPREAARGFVILEYVGQPQVAMLDGGLVAWKTVSTDVEIGPQPAVEQRGKLATRPEPWDLVDTQWVFDHLNQPGILLLDARPTFAAGHIPGAKQLVWNTLYNTSTLELKDVETLRGMFTAVGVDQHTQIVAYCQTGMTSSMLYFVARYLGYDVVLYTGSMDAWKAAHPDLVVLGN